MTNAGSGFKELTKLVSSIVSRHGVTKDTQNTAEALHYVYSLGYRDGAEMYLKLNRAPLGKRLIKGGLYFGVGYLAGIGLTTLIDQYIESQQKESK